MSQFHDERRTKSVRFSGENNINYEPTHDTVATYEAFTPKISRKVEYKNPEERSASCLAPPSSLSKPNCEDILKRVSVVIHQHIEKCELKLSKKTTNLDDQKEIIQSKKMDIFSEENFLSPQYVYHFVRQPISRMGFLYGIRQLKKLLKMPSLKEVHTFISDLFVKAHLSAECSIVCLIYVERLMEVASVPLCAKTWRPCVLCGLLLASKVWQDLSSWNIEISQIYPEFSLQSVNKLERIFCMEIKWDLYISSSAYAKYYFALRSLTEKKDFRRDYNIMVLNAPGAKEVAERSGGIKQTFLETTLSKSL